MRRVRLQLSAPAEEISRFVRVVQRVEQDMEVSAALGRLGSWSVEGATIVIDDAPLPKLEPAFVAALKLALRTLGAHGAVDWGDESMSGEEALMRLERMSSADAVTTRLRDALRSERSPKPSQTMKRTRTKPSAALALSALRDRCAADPEFAAMVQRSLAVLPEQLRAGVIAETSGFLGSLSPAEEAAILAWVREIAE